MVSPDWLGLSPISWQGYGLVLTALLFSVQSFLAVDRHSHSPTDTLIGVFPFVTPTFLLLDWIASKTSADSWAAGSSK